LCCFEKIKKSYLLNFLFSLLHRLEFCSELIPQLPPHDLVGGGSWEHVNDFGALNLEEGVEVVSDSVSHFLCPLTFLYTKNKA